jgi:hypothetical protein
VISDGALRRGLDAPDHRPGADGALRAAQRREGAVAGHTDTRPTPRVPALRAMAATISDESRVSVTEIRKAGGWTSPMTAERCSERRPTANALQDRSFKLDDKLAR